MVCSGAGVQIFIIFKNQDFLAWCVDGFIFLKMWYFWRVVRVLFAGVALCFWCGLSCFCGAVCGLFLCVLWAFIVWDMFLYCRVFFKRSMVFFGGCERSKIGQKCGQSSKMRSIKKNAIFKNENGLDGIQKFLIFKNGDFLASSGIVCKNF